MGLTATIKPLLAVTLTGSNDFAAPTWALPALAALELASGVGAGQADRVFADQRTLGAGGNDDFDLVGGALLDPMGAAFSVARIKALYIKNKHATLPLTLGGGAAPVTSLWGASGDVAVIRPGGFELKAAPDATAFVVTGTTADILRISNAGGSPVDYDIILIGASA